MASKYDIPALTKWANQSARQFWDYAKEAYYEKNIDIGEMPLVIMNPRLTSTAGRAFNCNTKIDLSCYLMLKDFNHFHLDTIPHELCHIIACRNFNSKGHDKAWYSVIDFLKVNTTRCHNLETLSQARKRS